MAYDIAGAFEDIELALIKSMRNNMQRHINEEYDEGINWTQWQAEMLSGLSQYRAENADVLKGYMGRINAELDAAIRDAYATGESEQEIELLKAIKRGYEAPKDGKKANMQGSFFRTNQKKLNALVNATTKDMKKAETALLRMTDDVYRQTLFKAQMFYNTGAGSMWQCVDMATKDFLASGINCVQYANGARVNIASYAEMALRTANKRANLMGQANTREKWGIHTVKVNARGIACPMCLQWLDKVYIDDVYGGGTSEESRKTGYPLLSTAVAGGLYHPNCKDSCSTYYEGISREPQEITKEQEKETLRRYNLEQKQRYYERNYKKNMRMGNGCLDQTDAKKYFARAGQYKDKLIELCDNNADVLRYDKARLSLRGVLIVDNVGRLSITPKANKNANTGKIQPKKDISTIKSELKDLEKQFSDLTSGYSYDDFIKDFGTIENGFEGASAEEIRKAKELSKKIEALRANIKPVEHTEQYKWMIRDLKEEKVEYRAVTPLKKKLTEKEIIDRISGGDMTEGSCASLAYTYVGNKAGIDVLDFRDGKSREFFAKRYNGINISQLKGVESKEVRVWNEAKEVMDVLKGIDSGKEYVLRTGKHAAVVRKTDEGILQYLELQSGIEGGNGFKDFESNTLRSRFGCIARKGKFPRTMTLTEVDTLGANEEFQELLGYINTASDKQKKGASGSVK